MFRALWLALLSLLFASPVLAAPPGYTQFAETKSFRFYSREEPIILFRTLAENAESLFAPVAEACGYTPRDKAEVILTRDLEEFVSLGFPRWAIGIAIPEQNLMAITATDRNGRTVDPFHVFQHEASHLALLRAVGPEKADRLPRWFVEGIATWQAGEASQAWDQELLTAARTGHLSSIYSIEEQFPNDDTLIGRAYGQSAAFVRFLAQQRGPEALGRAVKRISAGEPFAIAMRAELGEGVYELDIAFRKQITDGSSWLAIFQDGQIFWSLATLLFVLGYWRRRRQQQRTMAAMEMEEERARAEAESLGLFEFPYWEVSPAAWAPLAHPAEPGRASVGGPSDPGPLYQIRPTQPRPVPLHPWNVSSSAAPAPWQARPVRLEGDKNAAQTPAKPQLPAPKLLPVQVEIRSAALSQSETPSLASATAPSAETLRPSTPSTPEQPPSAPTSQGHTTHDLSKLNLPSLASLSAQLPAASPGLRVQAPYTVVDAGGAPLPKVPETETKH